MRKAIFFLIYFCISTAEVSGQNFVANFSFEDTAFCPNSFGQVTDASPWYSPSNGTPDLFHECSTFNFPTGVGVPSNWAGFQYASAGKGYSNIICYDKSYPLNREYIATPLITPMDSGQQYCISFYLSLADVCLCTVSPVQVALTNGSLTDYSTPGFISFANPVNVTTVSVTEKTNWKRVFVTYTATGGENYLTIGNFNTNSQTLVSYLTSDTSNCAGIFYIDDVSVTKGPCPTEVVFLCPNVFTPNEDGINDVFEINVENATKYQVQIFDRWGIKVFENSELLSWNGKNQDGNMCSEGVYFFIVTAEGMNGTSYSKKGFLHLLR